MLELVTGPAWKDNASSQGTMAKAQDLVGFFSSSSQAEKILLRLQAGPGRAVKCIQDVDTRHWSTYSMIERLLWLKIYFNVMVEQDNLPGDINLCADQWAILQSTAQVLKPFMFVQKLLEG